MLRMRRVTDQGFVVLALFVKAGREATLSARAVSESLELPSATTSKVLKHLQRSGFLASSRGLGGGYRLCCEPSDISVLQVIESFEGPLAVTECSVPDQHECGSVDACSLGDRWSAINNTVIDALRDVSLRDLVHRPGLRAAVDAETL